VTTSGRRERKKLQTRKLIADTARRLFAERGFEQVSVAEVAREADVAEATVFNYFPSKEDLVYSGLERFEEELLAAIRGRAPGETIVEAFGRFVLEPRGFLAARDEQAARRLLDVSRMIAQSPALLAREQQIFARYTDALAHVIADETSASSGDPRPMVAAASLIGVHRTLVEHVRRQILAGEPDVQRLARSTRTAGRRALSFLEHGLDDYGTKRS
jgi:AcrR family transcriptional regulator